MDDDGVDQFPAELAKRLVTLDESLTEVEGILRAVQKVPHVETQEQLKPLDKAKLDLVGTYAINSLFWVYLNVRGINPKEHAIKQELDRIHSYMTRVKEIQEKEAAPKLNVDASKRFVRNALWDAAHKKSCDQQHQLSASKRKSDADLNTLSGANVTIGEDVKRKNKKKKII